MRKISCLIIIFLPFLIFSSSVLAKIGVGINTGQIKVEEKLKAGMIYKLPSVTIINTGDEPADYETSIAYQQRQPELKPKQEWFIFTPSKFHLEPGKGQLVEIKINLPLKIEPGDYFCYLEGHPLASVEKGKANIGVAAGTKLYFTVVPANILYGVYFKIASLYKINQPWSNRIVGALAIIVLYWGMKKYLGFQISFAKKQSKKEDQEDE